MSEDFNSIFDNYKDIFGMHDNSNSIFENYMVEEEKFLSVPLCTLSMNYDIEELAHMILHFGITDFSKKEAWRLIPDTENAENETDEDFALWAYERAFNFKGANGRTLIHNHSIVQKHINNFVTEYGADAYFRIGRDLLFDAYKGKFPEIQFRVYAGIRSKLGAKKKYARITIDTIKHLMYGYKTKQAYQDSENINPYSNRQIRYAVDLLNVRNLITSFTFRNRFTYYSTRLSLEQLIQEIAQLAAKKKKNKIDTNKLFEKELAKALNV